jgi:hypothetical protein
MKDYLFTRLLVISFGLYQPGPILSAYQAEAWVGENLWPYILINITYIPVIALWGMVYYWGVKSSTILQRGKL